MSGLRTSEALWHVAPGFGAVADRFRKNFSDLGEIGAALCVYHQGSKVVDIWGGLCNASTGMAWARDTVVPVFSAAKGVVAITCMAAVSADRFCLDDRVAQYWPNFARNGKADITIRQILDHRAGLVLFGRPITRHDLADRDSMIRVMEAMRPRWRPGAAWGYQLATFGVLLAEILRRTDPLGRTFARMFEEDIARPLGLSFSFGLPDSVPGEHYASVARPSAGQALKGIWQAHAGLQRRILNPFSLLHRTLGEIFDIDMNDRAWLRNEFPSANGIGQARALASLYAGLDTRRNPLRLRPDLIAEIASSPAVPPAGDRDRVTGTRTCWHLGFLKPSINFPFSPSPRAFGMPGFGGSFAFYDPDRDFAYAYTPNRLGALPFNDAREIALREAVLRSLG